LPLHFGSRKIGPALRLVGGGDELGVDQDAVLENVDRRLRAGQIVDRDIRPRPIGKCAQRLQPTLVVLDRGGDVIGRGEHVADDAAGDLLGAHALADLADAQVEIFRLDAGRLLEGARDRRGARRSDEPGI
jgi:hypothetical protein